MVNEKLLQMKAKDLIFILRKTGLDLDEFVAHWLIQDTLDGFLDAKKNSPEKFADLMINLPEIVKFVMLEFSRDNMVDEEINILMSFYDEDDVSEEE